MERKNWGFYQPGRSVELNVSCFSGLEIFPGTLNSGTPLPISLPYHSHTSRDSMGMIWEAYGKGVPLLEDHPS